MFQGVGNFGLWMFSRGCGTRHRGCGTRSRALTRGFLIEKRLLTPSPDKSAGQAPNAGPDSGRGRVAKGAKPRQEFGVDRHYNRGSWQINPSSRTGLNSLKGVGDLV